MGRDIEKQKLVPEEQRADFTELVVNIKKIENSIMKRMRDLAELGIEITELKEMIIEILVDEILE